MGDAGRGEPGAVLEESPFCYAELLAMSPQSSRNIQRLRALVAQVEHLQADSPGCRAAEVRLNHEVVCAVPREIQQLNSSAMGWEAAPRLAAVHNTAAISVSQDIT